MWASLPMSSLAALLPFFAAAAPVDQPGTVTPGASRNGASTVFAAVLSDPDGVTSIDAATLTAMSDGQVAGITAAWTRRDANSFTHADSRRNVRWRIGTISVTYTDGNGIQSILTADWDVS